MMPQRVFLVGGALLALTAAGPSLLALDVSSPEVYLQLGDQLFEETRYREAAEAYGRVKGAPDEAHAYRAATGLVRSLLRVADFTHAKREADALAKGFGLRAEAIALHGDALWSMGLFPEAETRYRDALTLDAVHPRAHHGLARAFTARRKLDRALDHAQLAIHHSPRDEEIHHTLAFIHDRQRRFDRAAAALTTYASLLPPGDGDRALLARAQIQFLESFRGRTPLETDPSSATAIHKVPFRLVKDKIVVSGRINGGRPIDFVVDTGAEMTVLGRRAAERARISALGFTVSAGVGEAGLRGLQLARIDELEIGSYRVRNVPTIIKSPPLSGLPAREGESWSPPALGLSMIVDYQRRELTFGRTISERGEIEVPLYLYRLAMVRGLVNDREPASFVVDTGGEVISISTVMASALGPSRIRRIPLKVYGSSGWDRDAFLLPGLDLAFDRIRFDNFATVVLNLRAPSVLLGFELGGIVGHRFLKDYRVALDLEAGLLKLTAPRRTAHAPRAVPPAVPEPPSPSPAPPLSPE
jgi:predicted aspartyl protease